MASCGCRIDCLMCDGAAKYWRNTFNSLEHFSVFLLMAGSLEMHNKQVLSEHTTCGEWAALTADNGFAKNWYLSLLSLCHLLLLFGQWSRTKVKKVAFWSFGVCGCGKQKKGFGVILAIRSCWRWPIFSLCVLLCLYLTVICSSVCTLFHRQTKSRLPGACMVPFVTVIPTGSQGCGMPLESLSICPANAKHTHQHAIITTHCGRGQIRQ